MDDFVKPAYSGPDITEKRILEQATEGLKWLHSVNISKLSLLQVSYMEKILEKKYDITQNNVSSSLPMIARVLSPSLSLSSDLVVVGAG